MSKALEFAAKAERASRDLRSGSAAAERVLAAAERVSKLSSRVVSDSEREESLARIWAAYAASAEREYADYSHSVDALDFAQSLDELEE